MDHEKCYKDFMDEMNRNYLFVNSQFHFVFQLSSSKSIFIAIENCRVQELKEQIDTFSSTEKIYLETITCKDQEITVCS